MICNLYDLAHERFRDSFCGFWEQEMLPHRAGFRVIDKKFNWESGK